MKIASILLILLIFNPINCLSQNESNSIKWLKNNSYKLKTIIPNNEFDDLEPLKYSLKNVSVIGLGESSHGTSEFFTMKHRLLKFLVEEMGYTSFLLEASMSKCKYINDYVLYGKGNLDTAVKAQGFFIWQTEEFKNLIKWIRTYNKNVPKDKKVRFYGYDLQGNNLAWIELKNFYKIVNPAKVSFLDSLNIKNSNARKLTNSIKTRKEGEKKLNRTYIDCLSILQDITLQQGAYQYLTSKKTYKQNLMNIKLIIQENESYKDGDNDRRDYYMAQNILWLLSKDKKSTKVVVWAHNAHIEKAYYKEYGGTMGYYLSNTLKNKYYSLGFEFYSGSIRVKNSDLKILDNIKIKKPIVKSLPWYFHKTEKDNLFIDFRYSEPQKTDLYNQTLKIHSFGSHFSPKYSKSMFNMKLNYFDGMIYIEKSSPTKSIL